jgi:hypothetical protein
MASNEIDKYTLKEIGFLAIEDKQTRKRKIGELTVKRGSSFTKTRIEMKQ